MATIKVKKGDTLSAIAAKAGISLAALIKLNPQIKNPNLIKPGQVITTSKPTPAKPAPTKAPVPVSVVTPAAVTPTAVTSDKDLQIAAEKAAAEEKAKAYALSPAGMREAADKIIADQTAAELKIKQEATATALANKTESPGKAWIWNGSKWVKPELPSKNKVYNWNDETGWQLKATQPDLSKDPNEVVEEAGDYTFDVKTGILLFNGKPYTGTYNGFDYEGGNKKTATTGVIVDKNFDPLELEGPTDAELARLDAFAQLQDLFASYNLGSLAGKITEYMKAGKGPSETVLLLKKSDEYNLRFQGNTLRLAAGLNVMSESDYLELEDSYAETLNRYGLGSMLSTDRTKNEAMFAKYMGNNLAGPEFKDRIALATDRVMNADPGTKETFKKFFPNITDADLVSYFLSPKDTLSKLQEKATTAEIGSAALSQGLTTSLTSATDLAKFGIDKDAAIKGYSEIKEVLPTAQKLGSIYNEAGIKYDQASGEAEFLKQNEDARLKRKRLESLERGSFSGSAGMAASALRKSSTAGQV